MFTEEDDDPQTVDSIQHGGRIRSFKHERGNWAAYVYFPYIPEEGFLELLDEMTKVAGSNGISFTHTDEFHLSLSKTVVLRHHWIQSFIQSLRTGLAHGRRSAIVQPTFMFCPFCLCGIGVTILFCLFLCSFA